MRRLFNYEQLTSRDNHGKVQQCITKLIRIGGELAVRSTQKNYWNDKRYQRLQRSAMVLRSFVNSLVRGD